jgi:hypothetical protein
MSSHAKTGLRNPARLAHGIADRIVDAYTPAIIGAKPGEHGGRRAARPRKELRNQSLDRRRGPVTVPERENQQISGTCGVVNLIEQAAIVHVFGAPERQEQMYPFGSA